MTFESDARDRLLQFTRAPNFLRITEINGLRYDQFVTIAQDVLPRVDLDTALTGIDLDRLGGIFQRPRGTLKDPDYLKVLRIHIDQILSSKGTTTSMQNIVQLFTGNDPSWYSEGYPMGFVIGAEVPASDVDFLAELLRQAKPGAYNLALISHPNATPLLNDSVTTPIAGAGVQGSVNGPIAGELLQASVRNI